MGLCLIIYLCHSTLAALSSFLEVNVCVEYAGIFVLIRLITDDSFWCSFHATIKACNRGKATTRSIQTNHHYNCTGREEQKERKEVKMTEEVVSIRGRSPPVIIMTREQTNTRRRILVVVQTKGKGIHDCILFTFLSTLFIQRGTSKFYWNMIIFYEQPSLIFLGIPPKIIISILTNSHRKELY